MFLLSSRYLPFDYFVFQLNTKLDELSRLTESEYESNKTISIFQYFDKIYTVYYGKATFPSLIEILIQKKYARTYRTRSFVR